MATYTNEQAMGWWNAVGEDKQYELSKKYFPHMLYTNIDVDVVEIWEKEGRPSSSKDLIFEKTDGEIQVGDWFKSKFRTENKFFHYVHVKEITATGYICNETGTEYPKEDVLYKAKLYQEPMNTDRNC